MFVAISSAPGYEVDSAGNVRSLPRTALRRGHLMRVPGKVLRPWLSRGYPTVNLRVNGRTVTRRVHSIVMEVFGATKPVAAAVIRHYNGDAAQPSISNLIWGTQKDNMEDARRHGTLAIGERQGNARLTAADIKRLRLLRTQGRLYSELGLMFGISRHHASHIVRHLRWGHV